MAGLSAGKEFSIGPDWTGRLPLPVTSLHQVTLYLFVLTIFLWVSLKAQPNLKIFKDSRRLKLIYSIENVLVASHEEHITINSLFAATENSSEFGGGQSLVICLSDYV